MHSFSSCIRFAAVATALLVLPASAMCDTLVLRDGRVFQGKYLGGTQDWLQFESDGQHQEISVGSVSNITFSLPPPPPPPPPAAAKSMPAATTVPAGTRLLVRTDTPIKTGENAAGDRFSTTLETDVATYGVVVFRKGSKLYGRIVEGEGAKRLVGKARIVVELTDATVNNQTVPIMTDKLGYEGKGTGGDTLTKIGAGTAIGAVLDGKEGAAKGAAIGGGVALLTKGKQITVPAQTLLEFRLQQAVTVQTP